MSSDKELKELLKSINKEQDINILSKLLSRYYQLLERSDSDELKWYKELN